MKVRFCDNNKGKGKVLRRLREERPDIDAKVRKCLGICGACAEQPVALVGGKKVKGRDGDDLYRRIVAALAEENKEAQQLTGEGAMKVLVDLCIVPLGVGVSLSPYIAACQRVLTEAGLKTSLHSYGTNIEGEWDAVFAAVRRCHEVVHGMGAPRITTTVKLGTRTDRDQTMADKVASVKEKL